MRNAIWLFGLLAASTAWALDPAEPVVREAGGVAVEWLDGGLPLAYASTYPYRAASHRWEADGWRQQTPEEIADRAAARATAAQEAEQYAGPEPELFAPALDEDGNVVGTARIVVRAATWEIVGLTNSASPQRTWMPAQLDEYKSRIAKADRELGVIRKAKGKGNGLAALAERVAALEAFFGITEE